MAFFNEPARGTPAFDALEANRLHNVTQVGGKRGGGGGYPARIVVLSRASARPHSAGRPATAVGRNSCMTVLFPAASVRVRAISA